jgi:iron only hydrogenase large subunit-like protein
MQKDSEHIFFHHALKIQEDICIGCTHCMNVCPTQAIRVRGGKARLIDNRCVDCGECYKACPVSAITVEQDDFENIFSYRARVALVPGVLIGQFPGKVPAEKIYAALIKIGFTHVYEVENSIGFVMEGYAREREKNHNRPLISSFCPAIIRLIQVRYPSLVKNIMHIKPPMDIAALYFREKLKFSGFNENEIGIFYVTPCAAKIAAIKSPVGEGESVVAGVINMKFLYNRINKELSNSPALLPVELNQELLSREGVLWSLTNGEISNMKGRALAIDGIHNVSEILEKIENEEIDNIDFLELRACDQSCAGGILISGNRFLTVERLGKRADKFPPIANKALYLKNAPKNDHLEEILPRSIEMLDEDISVALRKMEEKRMIIKILPGIDCAACGAPNCETLAEDIVQGKADIFHCVFLQLSKLQEGEMDIDKLKKISEEIWGKDKVSKKIKI